MYNRTDGIWKTEFELTKVGRATSIWKPEPRGTDSRAKGAVESLSVALEPAQTLPQFTATVMRSKMFC